MRMSKGNSMKSQTHIALLSPAVGEGHNVGDYFIDMAIRRFFDDRAAFHSFTIRRPLRGDEIEAINTCVCALLCGTNLYQEKWPSGLTLENLFAIRIPVIPFGVGSSAATFEDTSLGSLTEKMIRALHDRCAQGSVRDPQTARVVGMLGVHNYMMTGCPVLFWAQLPELPRIRAVRRRRVVITARNWLMHRWPDAVDHPVQLSFLRRIFDAFSEHECVFVVHEDYDARLVDLLGIPSGIVFQSDKATDYIPLYTDPDGVILANRLHAGMLGLANGVPAVWVGHDTRTYSFCEMMDLACVKLFDPDSAEQCIRRMRSIMEGDVSEFEIAKDKFQNVRASMRRFLEANRLPSHWLAETARTCEAGPLKGEH